MCSIGLVTDYCRIFLSFIHFQFWNFIAVLTYFPWTQVWETGKRAPRLIQEVREHSKAVTCLYAPPSCDKLYSGSLDKTIRVRLHHSKFSHCIYCSNQRDKGWNKCDVHRTIALIHGCHIVMLTPKNSTMFLWNFHPVISKEWHGSILNAGLVYQARGNSLYSSTWCQRGCDGPDSECKCSVLLIPG